MAFDADVLVLKHAQAFHGADAIVMTRLVAQAGVDVDELQPAEGAHAVVDAKGAIAARRVLSLGVPRLWRMGYAGVVSFGARALPAIRDEGGSCRHVAMTIHGPGFGLDEVEAALSLVAGLSSAITQGQVPPDLERVTIVEHNRRRAKSLSKALAKHLADEPHVRRGTGGTFLVDVGGAVAEADVEAPPERTEAPHAFVAMPFLPEMEDVFYYGIQGPVQRWGRLCERVDQAVFSGDILTRILTRIASADVVIADLTKQNANVYLEVGYAWAKERPTVLLVQDVNELKFDVQGQRCIVYDSIRDLETKLERELAHLG